MAPLLLLLAAALRAQDSLGPGIVPATPDQARSRTEACGARHDDVAVGDGTVTIDHGAALSDVQLACLARFAAESWWNLSFDRATEARYAPLREQAEEDARLAIPRAWIEEHGLAGRLPAYRAGRDDAGAVGAAIAKLCGGPPTMVHRSRNGAAIVLDPPSFETEEAMQCIMYVGAVVHLRVKMIDDEVDDPPPPRRHR